VTVTRRSELNRDALADFALELKAWREAAGWTRAELSARLNYSESLIAAIEGQERVPQKEFAAKCDEVFETPGTFKRLEEKLHGVPFTSGIRPFAPYESTAVVLRLFELTLFPGLFQTEDYARAVLETHPNTTAEAVGERLTTRLGRQAIFTRVDPPPPVVWVLLDEYVLRREVGGPKVLREQVARVLQLAHQPNITVQVLKERVTHPGLDGPFSVAEVPGVGVVAYLEDAHDGQTIDDQGVANLLRVRWDTIRTEALSGTATLDLLEQTLATLEERCQD
jgi:transcriptional regulator with XRE-family HTH domain